MGGGGEGGSLQVVTDLVGASHRNQKRVVPPTGGRCIYTTAGQVVFLSLFLSAASMYLPHSRRTSRSSTFECDDVTRRAHVSRKREKQATAPERTLRMSCASAISTAHQCPREFSIEGGGPFGFHVRRRSICGWLGGSPPTRQVSIQNV